MKKFIFTGAILLFAFGAKAQGSALFYDGDGTLKNDRTVDMAGFYTHFKALDGTALFINGSSGDVGIGTMTPIEKFDVKGNLHANMGLFTSALDGTGSYSFSSSSDRFHQSMVLSGGVLLNPGTRARTFNFYDCPKSNFDDAATVILDIEDRSYMSRMRYLAEEGGSSYFMLFDKSQLPFLTAKEDAQASAFTLNDKNQQTYFRVQDDPSGTYLIMDKPNSNVCIGTNTNTDGDGTYYKLSVSGKVRAYEVKVYNTWADYVFEDDYVLKPLEEVEQFINENGHLPNVPSAEAIEEKGLELGNMMKIQQEKIEELTLYLIEQKKENDQLKKDVEELKALVKALTEKE